MLKRSWPRAIMAAVTGIGNESASCPSILPWYRCSSSRSTPRATVLVTGRRDPRPSAKKALASSGSYRGASCMSWRQAPSARQPAAISSSGRAWLRRNVGYSYRVQGLQKLLRRIALELRVGDFDAEKEPVARRARERRHVEHRVIRHRQPVERPHADKRRQRRSQHRRLEGDRNEVRPAV